MRQRISWMLWQPVSELDMKTPPHFDMQAWISSLPQPQRKAMTDLRNIITAIVPDVQETMSYGLPAFKIKGHGFLCMNVWKAHCALYPMSESVIADNSAALAGYQCTKGTIKFQPDKPLSAELVTLIIKARLSEIEAQATRGA
jgi:uncharacterized protein YdhG (YjbR/CyaY superfamily)